MDDYSDLWAMLVPGCIVLLFAMLGIELAVSFLRRGANSGGGPDGEE